MCDSVHLFKIWNWDRSVKKLITASSLKEIIEKGCVKLNLSQASNLRIVLEEDGTEVDDDDYLAYLPINSTLMLLTHTQNWRPSGKEDRDLDETDHAARVFKMDAETAQMTQALKKDLSRIITFSSNQLQQIVDCDTSELAHSLNGTERFAQSIKDACQRHLDERSQTIETVDLLKLYDKSQQANPVGDSSEKKRETIAKDLDILLVGKIGSGKSATGNSITGRKSFDSQRKMGTVTNIIQFEYSEFEGREIKVVDTPELGETILCTARAVNEAMACNPQGYHAILIVVKYGERFGKDDVQIVKQIKAIFGESFIEKHGILIFTCGDQFKEDDEVVAANMTFEDWVKDQSASPLTALVQECGNRYVLFDNRTKKEKERVQQLRHLIEVIDNLTVDNRRYTNEQFKKAGEDRQKMYDDLGKPVLKEEVIRRTGLITQELGRLTSNITSSEHVIAELQIMKRKASEIYQMVVEQDKGTGALKVGLKTVSRLKESINYVIDLDIQLIDKSEEEAELQKEMEKLRLERKQYEAMEKEEEEESQSKKDQLLEEEQRRKEDAERQQQLEEEWKRNEEECKHMEEEKKRAEEEERKREKIPPKQIEEEKRALEEEQRQIQDEKEKAKIQAKLEAQEEAERQRLKEKEEEKKKEEEQRKEKEEKLRREEEQLCGEKEQIRKEEEERREKERKEREEEEARKKEKEEAERNIREEEEKKRKEMEKQIKKLKDEKLQVTQAMMEKSEESEREYQQMKTELLVSRPDRTEIWVGNVLIRF